MHARTTSLGCAILLALLVAAPAPSHARLPSPGELERNLNGSLVRMFHSFGALHQLLGLTPQASSDDAQAACLGSGRCTLSAGLDALQLSALDLRDQAAGLQRDDTRLAGAYGGAAAESMQTAIRASADLMQVAQQLQQLQSQKSLSNKAPDLAAAPPSLRVALQRTFEALGALLNYLDFSGVPTAELRKSLASVPRPT